MQSILTVDASTTPAQIQVVSVENLRVKVIEKIEVTLDGNFYSRDGDVKAPEQPGAAAKEAGTLGEPTPGSLLKAAVSSLTNPWTSAVLIVPPEEYLSLNIELPFSDAKAVSRVLDLEVQDKVPFDLADFLIEHRVMGKLANNANDVHVSAFPRTPLETMLKHCRGADIEPLIVSTPASVLEAVLLLSASSVSGNCAVVLSRAEFTALLVRIDGLVRADRIFPDSSLAQITLSLRSVEQRYQSAITTGILLGSHLNADELTSSTGIPFQKIEVQQLSDSLDEHSALGAIAAVFGTDGTPYPVLTNFRTREFSYRPRLGELLRGLRQLVPYLILTTLLLAISAISIYYYRELTMRWLRDDIHRQISAVIPSAQLEDGKEVAAIQKENFTIENQLKELGSPSKFSPLDLLLDISKNFPASSDVQVRNISVKGNQIKIEGSADTYSAVETIDKALKARKSYCRVTKETTGNTMGRPNAKGFIFDIRLCE